MFGEQQNRVAFLQIVDDWGGRVDMWIEDSGPDHQSDTKPVCLRPQPEICFLAVGEVAFVEEPDRFQARSTGEKKRSVRVVDFDEPRIGIELGADWPKDVVDNRPLPVSDVGAEEAKSVSRFERRNQLLQRVRGEKRVVRRHRHQRRFGTLEPPFPTSIHAGPKPGVLPQFEQLNISAERLKTFPKR